MADINSYNCTGRLTRDPERVQAHSGQVVVRLRLAINDDRRNPETGDWEERPNFVDVICFGMEQLADSLSKGRRVGVTGSLRWSSWEVDGQTRQRLEVVARQVIFLDARPRAADGEDGADE